MKGEYHVVGGGGGTFLVERSRLLYTRLHCTQRKSSFDISGPVLSTRERRETVFWSLQGLSDKVVGTLTSTTPVLVRTDSPSTSYSLFVWNYDDVRGLQRSNDYTIVSY